MARADDGWRGAVGIPDIKHSSGSDKSAGDMGLILRLDFPSGVKWGGKFLLGTDG
jgi:hypothetical protein